MYSACLLIPCSVQQKLLEACKIQSLLCRRRLRCSQQPASRRPAGAASPTTTMMPTLTGSPRQADRVLDHLPRHTWRMRHEKLDDHMQACLPARHKPGFWAAHCQFPERNRGQEAPRSTGDTGLSAGTAGRACGEAGGVDREAWRIRALLAAAPAGCSHARPR
jgi:hypothetical protein